MRAMRSMAQAQRPREFDLLPHLSVHTLFGATREPLLVAPS